MPRRRGRGDDGKVGVFDVTEGESGIEDVGVDEGNGIQVLSLHASQQCLGLERDEDESEGKSESE